MREKDWLRRDQALKPGLCKCGQPRSVVMVGVEATESTAYREGVGRYCWSCDSVRQHPDKHTWWYMIGECREPGLRLVGGETGEPPELIAWIRPGASLPANDIIAHVQEIQALWRARKLDAAGQWALEWRDGEPWAPWCPVGFGALTYRRGLPLPYRRTNLRESKHDRTCVVCEKRFEAGDEAWRPYNPKPGSTVSSAYWTPMAHRDAMVCTKCVSEAKADASAPHDEPRTLALVES